MSTSVCAAAGADRGCVVLGGGCANESIGIASAPHWRGPYTRLGSTPIIPGLIAEDPSLWVDRRGNHHFLMHYIPDGVNTTRHAFSRSYTGPWHIRLSSIPYTTLVAFSDGSEETFVHRERPHIVFDENMDPSWLVSGVAVGGAPHELYRGQSLTLVQAVNRSARFVNHRRRGNSPPTAERRAGASPQAPAHRGRHPRA